MGDFYVNLSIKDASPDVLAEAFAAAKDPEIIGPVENGWFSLTSEYIDSQDQEAINMYLKLISERLDTYVVSVLNHDGDLLSVDIWRSGKPLAEYNSCPGYFKSDPSDADMAPRLSGIEVMTGMSAKFDDAKFTKTLLEGDDGYVDALDAHEFLIEALGLPGYSLGFGYANGL